MREKTTTTIIVEFGYHKTMVHDSLFLHRACLVSLPLQYMNHFPVVYPQLGTRSRVHVRFSYPGSSNPEAPKSISFDDWPLHPLV